MAVPDQEVQQIENLGLDGPYYPIAVQFPLFYV
jgi:hypothetical protein